MSMEKEYNKLRGFRCKCGARLEQMYIYYNYEKSLLESMCCTVCRTVYERSVTKGLIVKEDKENERN